MVIMERGFTVEKPQTFSTYLRTSEYRFLDRLAQIETQSAKFLSLLQTGRKPDLLKIVEHFKIALKVRLARMVARVRANILISCWWTLGSSCSELRRAVC